MCSCFQLLKMSKTMFSGVFGEDKTDSGLSFKHLLPSIHSRFVFYVFTPISNVTQLLILKHKMSRLTDDATAHKPQNSCYC